MNMPDAHAHKLDAELTAALRARGHRVTPQRLLIHRTLRELDRHVSADEVSALVSERLPNVSLPTVYATLELFERFGIVNRVAAGPGPVLYDPRTDEHHHVVCRRCGSVEDVEAAVDTASLRRAARRAGFAADRAEVVLGGLCARCASGR
jgi:Fe2+ or Zn2+ uptake regulation protein